MSDKNDRNTLKRRRENGEFQIRRVGDEVYEEELFSFFMSRRKLKSMIKMGKGLILLVWMCLQNNKNSEGRDIPLKTKFVLKKKLEFLNWKN